MYLPSMSATVSSRRFADKPLDFLRYIKGHSRTHEHHEFKKPIGVRFAEGVFTLVYLGIKPLHLVFDPATRRPSLSYMLQRPSRRPDPMAASSTDSRG